MTKMRKTRRACGILCSGNPFVLKRVLRFRAIIFTQEEKTEKGLRNVESLRSKLELAKLHLIPLPIVKRRPY